MAFQEVRTMSKIGKIEKQTHNLFLNFYEMEAHFRDGHVAPYYVASRAKEISQLKAVTRQNKPDGVILYGVYGEQKDKVVLIRQYRYPLGDYVYEFPAGLVEHGEDLLSSGIRFLFNLKSYMSIILRSDNLAHKQYCLRCLLLYDKIEGSVGCKFNMFA